MTKIENIRKKTAVHPDDIELSAYMNNTVSADNRRSLERHLSVCDECLAKVVSAYESVRDFDRDTKTRKGKYNFMKKINMYLVLAIFAFLVSFVFPRYFIQSLVATLLLGAKWIVDSRTTRMLITIYDAWKRGGEKEASRILETMNSHSNDRF